MATLPEHGSDKAARILAAARESVLRRGVKGVTVSEIAKRAHVGQGTVYLYWQTKEDLFVGLFVRDFLAMGDEFAEALTADPDLSRPHRLFPRLIRAVLERPFVRALQIGDADLLGVLIGHPRTEQLLDTLGSDRLMKNVLPVWRRYRLARTDWPLEEQAYALHALMLGFMEVLADAHPLPGIDVESPEHVMAAAVTALLGPEEASAAEVHATAHEGLRVLDERRQIALASIAPPEGR